MHHVLKFNESQCLNQLLNSTHKKRIDTEKMVIKMEKRCTNQSKMLYYSKVLMHEFHYDNIKNK